MSTPQPGVYRKGHDVRVADTAREAVRLAFDGYAVQTAQVLADSSYADLQAEAKRLGISANQSKDALVVAIDEATEGSPADGERSSERPAPDLSYTSGLPSSEDQG